MGVLGGILPPIRKEIFYTSNDLHPLRTLPTGQAFIFGTALYKPPTTCFLYSLISMPPYSFVRIARDHQ